MIRMRLLAFYMIVFRSTSIQAFKIDFNPFNLSMTNTFILPEVFNVF